MSFKGKIWSPGFGDDFVHQLSFYHRHEKCLLECPTNSSTAAKQAVLPVDDTDLEAILTALPTVLTTSRQECLEECGLTGGGDGE